MGDSLDSIAGGEPVPLRDVLQQHGASRTAAEAVKTLGDELRARTFERTIEFAAMIDAVSGMPVGVIESGSENQVEITSHIRAMMPGHRYIQLHTHLLGSSFSDADGALLVAVRELQMLVVTDVDEVWYVLSKSPRGTVAAEFDVFDAYHREALALRPRYLDLIDSGIMSRDDARRDLSHQVWRRIAPRLGLGYDRVESL